jgi:signal transduction histidine kinase
MDTYLKRLAEASLATEEAETAVAEEAFQTAREAIERAETELTELRAGWADMSGPERSVVGRTAAPLKERLDAAAKRIPKRTTLTEIPAEEDPEQELDPAA